MKRCGNCASYTKLRRFGLCERFDGRTSESGGRKCPVHTPIKFIRTPKHQQVDVNEILV